MSRLLALVVLVGCTSDDEVVIRAIDRYYTPAGIVDRPTDLTGVVFSLYGTEVAGDASGVVRFADAPAGQAVVAVARDTRRWWIATRDGEFEWVSTYGGRADAVQAEVQQPVALDVALDTPWTGADRLSAHSRETTTYVPVQPQPSPTSTTLALTFDWNGSGAGSLGREDRPYLMEAGDSLTLARTRLFSSGEASVDALVGLLDIDAPPQPPGGTTTVTGAMASIPQTQSTTFTIDHAAFDALIPADMPYASWTVSLVRQPPWLGAFVTPSLVRLSHDVVRRDAPETYAIAHGDAFDAAWPRFVFAQYAVFASSPTPPIYSNAFRRFDGDSFTLQPPLPFATDVVLDGDVLTVPGADDGFQASIYREVDNGLGEDIEYVGYLYSESTDTFVNGVLLPGETYMIGVHLRSADDEGWAVTTNTAGPFVIE